MDNQEKIRSEAAKFESEELEGDGGAGFGISKGVMVVGEIVSTGSGGDMELVAGEFETAPRGCQGAIKLIFGVLHSELGKGCAQTTFVEWPVVRY